MNSWLRYKYRQTPRLDRQQFIRYSMGAFGYNAFEDDSACDFWASVYRSNDLKLVVGAFTDVLDSDFIDSDEGTPVLVAIYAILALADIGAIDAIPDAELPQYWKKQFAEFSTANKSAWDAEVATKTHAKGFGIKELAKAALNEINTASKSELYVLWKETDYFADWQAYLEKLASRVNVI